MVGWLGFGIFRKDGELVGERALKRGPRLAALQRAPARLGNLVDEIRVPRSCRSTVTIIRSPMVNRPSSHSLSPSASDTQLQPVVDLLDDLGLALLRPLLARG